MRVLASLVVLAVFLYEPVSAQQKLRCIGNCCDTHRFCVFWSQRNECNANPRWMIRNCPVSCNGCFRGNMARPQPVMPMPQPMLTATKRNSSTSIPPGCNSVVAVEVQTRQVRAQGQVKAQIQKIGCAEPQAMSDCSVNACYHMKYRSIDGTCNNKQNTVLGGALNQFARLLPSAYDDGFNTLVSASTRRRPNPREVSMFLLSSSRAINSHANSLLMQFGQFVSHDMMFNAAFGGCSCQMGRPRCENVPMPPSDRRGRPCIAFTRAFPVCSTGIRGSPREQFNLNTAFLDASTIYSSEAVTLRNLRQGAMLRTNIVNGRVFPPNNRRSEMKVGDTRGTLFVGLAAMHTTFLRLHNNIAARLQNMNPRWNQDRTFQETRKIVGGVLQAVVYQEFLPTLIGPFMNTLVPKYRRYNPAVNPGVINEFSAAAYRLHGMIQENYPLLGPNFEQIGRVPFLNGVNNIEQVLAAIDSLYRGFGATPARSPQRITTSVTENLFGGDADMATFNIQRGRDHGLRSYNDYRRLCNLQPVIDFRNWAEVTNPDVRERVQQLYATPDNLDLYVGGILEEPQEGSMVGPTFACIIAEQFTRLRDGDRFYYENPTTFTPPQLAAIKNTTLSWVLCDTGDSMTRISPAAFKIDRGERAVPCSNIAPLDLGAWFD